MEKHEDKRGPRIVEVPSTPEPQVNDLRRTIVKVVGLITLLGGGVGGTLATRHYLHEKEKDEANTDLEKQIEMLIPQIEEAMEGLSKKAEPLIASYQHSYPMMQEFLRVPFGVVAHNASNPLKNAVALYTEVGLGRFSDARTQFTSISFPDPTHFAYGITSDLQTARSRFTAMDRLVLVKKNFDVRRLFDLLSIYHEARHASQYNFERLKMIVELQNTLKKNIVIINDEAEAWAADIEIVNLLVNGKLTSINIDDLVNALNAREEDREDIEFLQKLARIYFSKKQPFGNGIFDFSFYNAIGELYRYGRELFMDVGNKLVHIPQR